MTTRRVDLRLGEDLAASVEQFRAASGIDTPAQAVRALIILGLEKAEGLDVTWRRIAFQEGLRRAAGIVKGRLGELLHSAMGEFK